MVLCRRSGDKIEIEEIEIKIGHGGLTRAQSPLPQGLQQYWSLDNRDATGEGG
jgi:hypothetical protein